MNSVELLGDLNRWKTFFLIYETGKVSEAAQMLGVTQSAVSQSLKLLETQMAIPLFVRVGKRMQPTQEGHKFHQVFTPFFSELQQLIQQVRGEKEVIAGHLRLGGSVTFGECFLTSWACHFRNSYEEVKVSLNLSSSSQVLPHLLENRLDMVFCGEGFAIREYPQVEFKKIYELDLVMVASIDWQEKGFLREEGVESLAALPHIGYEQKVEVLKRWYQYHFRKKMSPSCNMWINHLPSIKRAVEQGQGVAVLPWEMVKQDILSEKLVLISRCEKPLKSPVYMGRLRGKKLSALEKAWWEFLSQRIA